MLPFPSIDPVLFAIGPVKVHWYGMMYLLGFLAAWWLGTRRARQPWSPMPPARVEDLIFYGALGVVLGGRLGFVLFYGFDQFVDDPLWLFRVWEGGMSFHGGLLGVFVALVLFARKLGQPLGAVCDFVAPLAPLGLGLGRLANFINAELYGRATDAPWGMVFPTDPEQLARHPSQLYQFFLEGILLFACLLWFSRVQRRAWSVTALFLLLYGCFRFVVEFFRQPDAGIGFDLFGWLTRGQLLSLPMIAGGIALWLLSARWQLAVHGVNDAGKKKVQTRRHLRGGSASDSAKMSTGKKKRKKRKR